MLHLALLQRLAIDTVAQLTPRLLAWRLLSTLTMKVSAGRQVQKKSRAQQERDRLQRVREAAGSLSSSDASRILEAIEADRRLGLLRLRALK